MSTTLKVCVAAALLGAMSVATAADKYSETETHVVRGISERMNTLNRFSKLAMEKSSSELVKTFAKRDIEEHEKLSAELTALAKSLGIAGVGGGMPAGAAPGGAPGAAPPAGGAPQGAGGPPAGAGPQVANGAGRPGGAAGGQGGAGPNTYASRYYTQLQGLSDEAFDEMYMLRALQYHEDIERSMNEEIRGGFSKELMDWSKANIQTYEAHAQLIQRILYGEQKTVPATGPLKATMAARPEAGAAPAAK